MLVDLLVFQRTGIVYRTQIGLIHFGTGSICNVALHELSAELGHLVLGIGKVTVDVVTDAGHRTARAHSQIKALILYSSQVDRRSGSRTRRDGNGDG